MGGCSRLHKEKVSYFGVRMQSIVYLTTTNLFGPQGHHSPANMKPTLTMPNKYGRH